MKTANKTKPGVQKSLLLQTSSRDILALWRLSAVQKNQATNFSQHSQVNCNPHNSRLIFKLQYKITIKKLYQLVEEKLCWNLIHESHDAK